MSHLPVRHEDDIYSMSTHPDLEIVYGECRPGKFMHGVFAKRNITKGEALLTWVGIVSTDYEDIIDVPSKCPCNLYDISRYVLAYDRGSKLRVVCPRLKTNGRPYRPGESNSNKK